MKSQAIGELQLRTDSRMHGRVPVDSRRVAGIAMSQGRGAVLCLLGLLAIVAGMALNPQSVIAGAVRSNPGFESNLIPRNDDGSTNSAVPLGFTVNFFGLEFSEAFINNNGNITFGDSLATFTPEGLVASPLRIIAPFWGDVDTRASGSELVKYGQDVVDGRPAFGVNWVNVGYFGNHDDKLNSFQLVLIERSDIGPGNFDIEFNYDRIEWETGDASGGSGGLGGTSASAGYSNGSGKPEDSFEILGSRQNGVFLDSSRFGLIRRRLNSEVRGRLVFFVRDGAVECTFSVLSIDEPFPWQGGEGAVQVAAPFDCEWTITNNSTFVAIEGESTRNGSANVLYTVAENRGPARSATITVAGEVILVLQDGLQTIRANPVVVNLSTLDGVFPSRAVLRVEAIEEPVTWVASIRMTDGSSAYDLRLSPNSGVATLLDPSLLTIDLDTGIRPPTPAVAEITLTDVQFNLSIKVPVILGWSEVGPRLRVSQSSVVFQAVQGGGTPSPQTLSVMNAGEGALGWSIPAEAVNAATWLNVSALSGTALAGPFGISTTQLSVNPSGLGSGTYQTLLPIHSAEPLDQPQLVSVTLQVAESDSEAFAALSPRGMVFQGLPGGLLPVASQRLEVNNLGAAPLTYQITPGTADGVDWLQVSSRGGVANAGTTGVDVSVDTENLSPGIFRGGLDVTFSDDEVQHVQVLLVVESESGNAFRQTSPCVASGLEMVPTTMGNGAVFTSSYPVPLLTRLVDTCGDAINDATVLVDIDSDTIRLEALGSGLYSAMWTPGLSITSLEVTYSALHPAYGLNQSTFDISITDPAGPLTLPGVRTDGVLEAAGFSPGWPLAPGGIVSIFGSGLAAEDNVATTLPLPRELGGVRVRVGDEYAPLFYAGPTQINAQVPYSARPGESISIVVEANGQFSAPQSFLVLPVRPGIFLANGTIAALDGESRVITSANPARIGGVLQIFAAGLEQTSPPAETGAAAPASSTLGFPLEVSIGGENVPVTYQGLAPGLVGVYQINVLLPGSIPVGDEVPVVITQNGMTSNPNSRVIIPVR